MISNDNGRINEKEIKIDKMEVIKVGHKEEEKERKLSKGIKREI